MDPTSAPSVPRSRCPQVHGGWRAGGTGRLFFLLFVIPGAKSTAGQAQVHEPGVPQLPDEFAGSRMLGRGFASLVTHGWRAGTQRARPLPPGPTVRCDAPMLNATKGQRCRFPRKHFSAFQPTKHLHCCTRITEVHAELFTASVEAGADG